MHAGARYKTYCVGVNDIVPSLDRIQACKGHCRWRKPFFRGSWTQSSRHVRYIHESVWNAGPAAYCEALIQIALAVPILRHKKALSASWALLLSVVTENDRDTRVRWVKVVDFVCIHAMYRCDPVM